MTRFQDNQKIIRMISVGAIIQSVEFFVPYPVPGAKIGFANIITVMAIYTLDFSSAFKVAFFRPIVGAIISGSFLTAGSIISFASAIVSFLTMWIFFKADKNFGAFSVYGVSVAGAVSHNLSQIAFVYFWLLKIPEILYLAPVLALAGVVSGAFIGYCSSHIFPKVELKNRDYTSEIGFSRFQLDKKHKLKLFIAILIGASSFFLNSNHYYLVMNTLVVIFIIHGSSFMPKKYFRFIPIIVVLMLFPTLFGRDINYGILAALRILLLFHLSMWITKDLLVLSEKSGVVPVDTEQSVVNNFCLATVFKNAGMLVMSSVIHATNLTQKIKKSELKNLKGLMNAAINLL